MNAIRRQFFLSYAVIGSVMPLMSVFLREEAGFSFFQVGLATALMNIPMICSPALITLLADRNLDPRRILAVAFTCSATVLSLIYFSGSTVLTLALFIFHGLAFVAMIPLQDGYYFSLAEQARKKGRPVLTYPLVRVWGTVGFILPSVILFVPLSRGASAGAILPCAVGFCLLSIANSFTLFPVERISGAAKQLPTVKALRMLFSPGGRWLCVGLFFAFLATTSYYSFIGIYFDEVIGIPKRHIGLIINLGVVLEIGYTLLMPWMQSKIRLKGIMVLGLTTMVVRMVVLALFPTYTAAILTQVFHGIEVLAIFVGPVMFLDRLAGDEFRNSIQGVFTMAVGGTSRVIAGVLAGLIVTHLGLTGGLVFGAALGCVSVFVIAFLFARIPPRNESGNGEITVSPAVES